MGGAVVEAMNRQRAKAGKVQDRAVRRPSTGQHKSRTKEFWEKLQHYNELGAKERGDALEGLGITATSADVLGILTKSHFVIPGVTRYECQMCGECCRYARKVANFTYEACPFLNAEGRCSKHDKHYLVCRWFPFYVHHDPDLGDLLTIKPYCTGYGKGPLVDYDSKVREINGLALSMKSEEDGAWVIHEVLYLPDRGEWSFPSRENLDHLLRYLGGKGVEQKQRPQHRSAELSHAQNFTSGLLGSIHDPQVTIDEKGVITDANEAFAQLCAKPLTQVVEQDMAELFVNQPGMRMSLKECFTRGRVAAVPHRLLVAGTGGVPVLLNAVTYRDRSDGLVHGALVSLQAVSASVFNDLLQSQSYARGLIESSLDPLVFLDLDGVVLDVNNSTMAITGRDRDAMLGSRFIDYFDSPTEARRGIELTLANGSVRNFELGLINAQGRRVPVQFNATVYHDPNGEAKGIFAAARDVSEMKYMFAQLQDAKDYARGLIEASLDLMVTIDRRGIITDVNEAAAELAGRSREALIGSRFFSLFTDVAGARHGLEYCFQHGQIHNHELSVLRPDGSIVPVSFNASVYRSRDGEEQGVFGVARDVRDRLKMVRQLEEARNYARGLIESSPDLMLTIGHDGLVADVNEEAVRLTGRLRTELVGSSFGSHFTDPDRAEQGVRQTLKEGIVRDFDLELRREDGQVVSLSFSARPYLDGAGKVAGIFAIARAR